MRTDIIAIPSAAPGLTTTLTVHRFGVAGAARKAYVQAALHADEIPGMICAHHLREQLKTLDAAGRISGEIVLVPMANPIGLAQRVLGSHLGRFDLADGGNFNRHFPALAEGAAARVADKLGPDADHNVALIRDALRAALAQCPALTPAEHLKRALLGLALDADVVLDLHCDSEAVMHLYTLTPQAETFAPLARLLGARAMLLASESGDDPFDEACSRPWAMLAARYPEYPVPLACAATTVELRGDADVSHELATRDAAAIVGALTVAGFIAGDPPELPPPLYRPTTLEASEPVTAPVSGMVVYRRTAGDMVGVGDVVAEIVDPVSGVVTPVHARSAGLLYARGSSRFASAGRRLGKIAGETFRRSGKLLSP
jgi:predicted deacylase